MFLQACVKNSVHGGHVWRGGLHGRGACMVGEGMCMAGGVCGRGACMAGGHVQPWGMRDKGTCMARGVCMVGGFPWRGHAWPPPPGGYYDIGSMSGWYASYWNAFFLNIRNFSIDMGTMINVQIIRQEINKNQNNTN